MKLYKLMFMSLMMMSTIISVSSYSWMGMWIGLEMNIMSIIPLMKSKLNVNSNESSIKYFIVQSISSTLIMMSMIMMIWKMNFSVSMSPDSDLLLMMNTGLLIKMGMAPFHFWFPEVIEGIDWLNCMLIMTWQKIAPMILLMFNVKFSLFLVVIIIMSMIISSMMSMNQISLRKIMTYSSINNMGWMMSMMMLMQSLWMLYFIIYSILMFNIIYIMNKGKLFFIKQLFLYLNNNLEIKMFFMLNFFSLMGIPPFIGFLIKWLSINVMLENNMMILPMIMLIFTLIMIYVYMRMTLMSFILTNNEINWKPIKWNINNSFLISMMNFLLITSLIIMTFMFNLI